MLDISDVVPVERTGARAPHLASDALAGVRRGPLWCCHYDDGTGNSASSPGAGYEPQKTEMVLLGC